MSWKATAFVKDIRENILHTEKFVLLLLAEYHNPARNVAWPSVPTLAADAILSERQMTRVLASLEQKGFIARSRENSPRATVSYEICGLHSRGDNMSTLGVTSGVTSATSGVTSEASRGDICDTAIRKEPLEPLLEPIEPILRAPRKIFNPPRIEEVKFYATQIKAKSDPEAFFDHFTANGWKTRSGPLKDWQAAFRNWERNNYKFSGGGNNGNGRRETKAEERARKTREAAERVRAEILADNSRIVSCGDQRDGDEDLDEGAFELH